jgi:hypothetical protein
MLGRLSDERFVMQQRQEFIRPVRLADGRQLFEFNRYCNHPVSISQGATSRGLAYAISAKALSALKARQGYMIVYAHLGKNDDCPQPIAHETQQALRDLQKEYLAGNIYVTTTLKLLNYYHACRYLVWSADVDGSQSQIEIQHMDDPVFGQHVPSAEQLQGLTFDVPDSSHAVVYVDGKEVAGLRRNAADREGKQSITIPFTRLSFPDQA